MEYKKIINLWDNTPKQPSKFKTKNWIGIHDKSREVYNEDNQIRFKTSMFSSSLCDYSDVYIHVTGTITVAPATAAAPVKANKNIIFENCKPFTNCISRINNKRVDDAHDIDVVMPMYKLIE